MPDPAPLAEPERDAARAPKKAAKRREKPGSERHPARWVALGVVVLFFGIALYEFLSSPRAEHFFRAAAAGRRVMQEGEIAPGASAVKRAGGCAESMIIDPAHAAELRTQLDPESDGGHGFGSKMKETTVICVTPMFRDPPACDALAHTYVDAVHPAGRFRVTVRKRGSTKHPCSTLYEASGEPALSDVTE